MPLEVWETLKRYEQELDDENAELKRQTEKKQKELVSSF